MMRQIILKAVGLLILTISSVSCTNKKAGEKAGSNLVAQVKAVSNAVKTVEIGGQIWTQENLNVDCFRNGDKIKEISGDDHAGWEKAGKDGIPAWCYFGTDMVDSKVVYKKLYNWHAVNDPRGLAPKGWHIPSDSEWSELESFLNPDDIENAWLQMKSTKDWDYSQGTNESGFTAVPGGYRNSENHFDYAGSGASFWSSAEYDKKNAYGYHIEGGGLEQAKKESGFSVRCIKD
jgi:uncharacterized protein (TIGR02145 family)